MEVSYFTNTKNTTNQGINLDRPNHSIKNIRSKDKKNTEGLKL